MHRFLLLGILLTLLTLAWPIAPDLRAQSAPFLQGTSTGYGWTISVSGSQGTFQADGVEWQIEYIFQSAGFSGFKHALWFLGRKSDNLMLLHVYVDDAGTSFLGIYYNYKERTQKAERFVGEYGIAGLSIQPTRIEDYVPHGRIPTYAGESFRISSPHSNLSPLGGTVSYQGLDLTVYPVFNVIVTPTWSEFWSIGIDPHTQHTYFLIYYSISPSAWTVDLWSGQVTSAILGQAVLNGGQVTVEHNAEL